MSFQENEIIIRQAAEKDLKELLIFEQGVINAERPFDPTLKREHTNYYDLQAMIASPQVRLVVAEMANKLIASGYARIEKAKDYLQHGYHAYLGFIYVVPEFRGKGISGRIIEELKKWARSQNINEMRLEVYYQNISAIKAYEKIGFSKHMIEMRCTTE